MADNAAVEAGTTNAAQAVVAAPAENGAQEAPLEADHPEAQEVSDYISSTLGLHPCKFCTKRETGW